jgi:hypothetical protein
MAPHPIAGTYPSVNTAGMPKRSSPHEPQPAPLPLWIIHRVAHKAIWIGEVEAADERAAIEKAAEQLKVPATKLMATRRR